MGWIKNHKEIQAEGEKDREMRQGNWCQLICESLAKGTYTYWHCRSLLRNERTYWICRLGGTAAAASTIYKIKIKFSRNTIWISSFLAHRLKFSLSGKIGLYKELGPETLLRARVIQIIWYDPQRVHYPLKTYFKLYVQSFRSLKISFDKFLIIVNVTSHLFFVSSLLSPNYIKSPPWLNNRVYIQQRIQLCIVSYGLLLKF